MAMKITVMDKRHKGVRRFAYYVAPTRESMKTFVDWREWCWETFGPGTERDLASNRPDAQWAWHSVDCYRIYFKSSKELNWFKMKWL